jgi:hypothetical protein
MRGPTRMARSRPRSRCCTKSRVYARTNLDAMLVHTASSTYQQIWGGNFLHAEVTE